MPTALLTMLSCALLTVAPADGPRPGVVEARDVLSAAPALENGLHELTVVPGGTGLLRRAAREAGAVRLISFPLDDMRTVDLRLRVADPFAPGASFRIERGLDGGALELPARLSEDALVLVGRVAGDPDSFAVIGLHGTDVHGLVETGSDRVVLASARPGSGRPPILYDPAVALEGRLRNPDFDCGTEPPAEPPPPPAPGFQMRGSGDSGTGDCRFIHLAIEYDHECWTDRFDSEPMTALFYTTLLVSSLDQIYRRDIGVGIRLSHVRAWETVDDPWDSTFDKFQLISQFKLWYAENAQDVPRDVAMLLSGRSLNGGAASGALCPDDLSTDAGPCSVGAINGSLPSPLEDFNPANWDIYLTAHELGHNLGAPHTHDYCPPLDQCASPEHFGACQTAQICTPGTVMSYCHTSLCGGIGNQRLGFHPTVAQTILDTLAVSECVEWEPAPLYLEPDTATTRMNTDIRIDVLENDIVSCTVPRIVGIDGTSAAGGTTRYSPGTGPGGRTEIYYRPPIGFIGLDTFLYTGGDGLGNRESVLVTVDVTEQLRRPDLLVTDVELDRVLRFDWETGEFLGVLVPQGEGDLDAPTAVAVAADGSILVASSGNERVSIFHPESGVHLGTLGEGRDFRSVSDLHFVGDRLYVSSAEEQHVLVLDPSGTEIDRFSTGLLIAAQLQHLTDSNEIIALTYEADHPVQNGGLSFWDMTDHELTRFDVTVEVNKDRAVTVNAGGAIIVGGEQYGDPAHYSAHYNPWSLEWIGAFFSGPSIVSTMKDVHRLETSPDGWVFATSETGLHRFSGWGTYQTTLAAADEGILVHPMGMHFRPEATLPGDADGDGRVGGSDIAVVLGNWGRPGPGDLDGNGTTDGIDLAIVLGNWT